MILMHPSKFVKLTNLCMFPELPERVERLRAVYQKVDELPPANYNTLERLIFHLVR